MIERQAMNQEHPLNFRHPRSSAFICGKQTHKSVIESIRRLITALGGVCNVTHQSGRLHGSAGVPDLYCQFPAPPAGIRDHDCLRRCGIRRPQCMARGVIHCHYEAERPLRFWIEVKVGRDKLRPAQIEFMQRETACGGTVLVGGVSEVIAHLRANGFKVEG